MIRYSLKTTPRRFLFFDIENRPLSYWFDGRCTAEVTAIGWAFDDEYADAEMAVGYGVRSRLDMLRAFKKAYDEADMVVGHYIRKHDLPLTNAAMVENGLATLGPKLTIDTRDDLQRWKDVPKSLEYLASMLGVSDGKHHLTAHEWRHANRLSPDGRGHTYKRVTTDVEVTRNVYKELVKRGLIVRLPKVWQP